MLNGLPVCTVDHLLSIFAKKSVDKARISVGLLRLLRIFPKLPQNTVAPFAIPGGGRGCPGSSLLTLALWPRPREKILCSALMVAARIGDHLHHVLSFNVTD